MVNNLVKEWQVTSFRENALVEMLLKMEDCK